MSDNLRQEMTEAQKRQATEAIETLYMLADQVGVHCGRCRTLVRGSFNVGAVSFMAPFGTDDYRASPYCRECADRMRGE